MRHLVSLFLLLVAVGIVVSCNSGKREGSPFSAITEMVDSANTTVDSAAIADSLARIEEEENSKPVQADELFEDFMYNFSSDARFQRWRVKFPLEFDDADTVYHIERKYWKQDSMFSRSNVYYMLFDSEDDLELEGDTSLSSVKVEWTYLATKMEKTYYFDRIGGAWVLTRINLQPLQLSDSDFTSFYYRFATDSLFQSKHVSNPIEFVTVDPDDEFSILQTTLGLSEWFAFRPDLPTDALSNIDYGQHNTEDSDTKILKLNSFDGYSTILYFKKRRDEWELYKFEDTSI